MWICRWPLNLSGSDTHFISDLSLVVTKVTSVPSRYWSIRIYPPSGVLLIITFGDSFSLPGGGFRKIRGCILETLVLGTAAAFVFDDVSLFLSAISSFRILASSTGFSKGASYCPTLRFRLLSIFPERYVYELAEGIKENRSRKVAAPEVAWVERYDPNRLEPFE